MRIKQYIQDFVKPYDEEIAELTEKEQRLARLYETIKSPGFNQVLAHFKLLKSQAEALHDKHSGKSIFTIWFYLKSLWQCKAKKEMVDSFEGWVNSVEGELIETSENLTYLIKGKPET